MDIRISPQPPMDSDADGLLVLVPSGDALKTGAAFQTVDGALAGALSAEVASADFKGKTGSVLTLNPLGRLKARQLILVGVGAGQPFDLRRAAAAAGRQAARGRVSTLAVWLPGLGDAAQEARLLVEGALLGTYRFLKHKKKPAGKDGEDALASAKFPSALVLHGADTAAIEQGSRWGRIIAEHTNLARDWVFDGPNHVTPHFLAEQAKAISGLATCDVMDTESIRAIGMNTFALVAQGSDSPAFFIHLRYTPPHGVTPKKKVALVGKGITFDSGGLSLKPPGSMELMKDDMAGAAAVLATMKAIGALAEAGHPLDMQVDAYVPTCENMPSGHASKPGDIVTSLAGKTIEINNTDAEGRLILCDALTYAQRQEKPDELIDLATLTGACVVALGKVASGIMGTDSGLIERLRASGERAGEKFWQLPLYEEYEDFLKSDVADLINAGAKGEAGSSAGGMFLKAFVENGQAWAHLDIAGPAYTSKDVPEVPKGATGVGVRTLLYDLFGLE